MQIRPVLLVVMDGWGIGDGSPYDAVAMARTPHFDRLWEEGRHTKLHTHGRYVGLPSDTDLGGSEVGHLTMGAGRILDQGPTRINRAIEDGSFFRSPALRRITQRAQEGGTLHLIGLLSDGNIHSHIDHFEALIRHADDSGVMRLRLHTLLDGRDVGVQTAQDYVQRIEHLFTEIQVREPTRDYAFASGGGRESITMDRDRQWDKVKEGWDAHVHGQSPRRFPSMMEAIERLRAEHPGIIDQDLPGFVIVDAQNQPRGAMRDGDAVIMVNFRGDRAIELCEAFCLDEFTGFDRGPRPDVLFAGMMVYDEDRNLPEMQLMGPTIVERTLGRMLVQKGIPQFRLSETQKYPHVTFFFNGGYREPLDASLEDYVLIPSDRGISFADAPRMKSVEITDRAVRMMQQGRYGFGLINYPNADMVGHCGLLRPAIAAIEAVDEALGRLRACAEDCDWAMIVTADHGNAEQMRIADKHGHIEASTRHSLNPVPCIVHDPRGMAPPLRQPRAGDTVEETPGLSHLAATALELMGLDVPADFAPSLFSRE